MVDSDKEKDTSSSADNNNDNNQANGGEKTFTQEQLEKAISDRLKRERKKHEAEIEELKATMANASDDKKEDSKDKSELDQMKELVSKLTEQMAQSNKEKEQERFEKQILKYAAKYEVDAERALKYLDPSKINKNEDGEFDFDSTFSEFAEFAGKKKADGDGGNIGEPPKKKTKFTKTYAEATVEEKKEYLDTYGAIAFGDWMRKK